MGYYTRVFCRSERSPSFTELQEYLSSRNPLYRLEGETDDEKSSWTNFELFYKDGHRPIPVELNWCDEDGSVGDEERAEFLDIVGSPGLSLKKRKVIRLLRQSNYIVCNQLLSDLDDDGFLANDILMQFFVEKFEGMVHAENEGFYDREGKLLLKDE